MMFVGVALGSGGGLVVVYDVVEVASVAGVVVVDDMDCFLTVAIIISAISDSHVLLSLLVLLLLLVVLLLLMMLFFVLTMSFFVFLWLFCL